MTSSLKIHVHTGSHRLVVVEVEIFFGLRCICLSLAGERPEKSIGPVSTIEPTTEVMSEGVMVMGTLERN
jgi:hypothetical protein